MASYTHEIVNPNFGTLPQPVQKKKNFLVDNISTGGGMAGAAAGAAGGAALGSVVPGIGTAIGGLLGAILGGATGSAGGQVLENKVAGDNLTKDVGQEALLGGLTSVGPIRALSVGGGLLKGAAEAALKDGGGAAIKAGLEKGIAATPIRNAIFNRGATAAGDVAKTSAAGKLATSGNKALASQYGVIDKPVQRATNPAQTVSQLASMGITKPVDAERLAGAITGPDGILTRQVAKAVDNAGGVDTSSLRTVLNDAMDNIGVVDKDRKSLMTYFDANLKAVNGGARGSLSPTVNSTDALGMMKKLEGRIADLQGKGLNYRQSTPERADMAHALQLVRDELENKIYEGAGANKNLAGLLTPELRDKLVGLMPNNNDWAKHVDQNIMKAGDVGALRSAQAPFVKVKQMIDNADNNMFSAGGRMATSATGIKDAIVNAGANMVKNPAARAYAGATRGVAGAGAGSGISPLGSAARVGVGSSLINAAINPQDQQVNDSMSVPGGDVLPQDMTAPASQDQTQANPFGISKDRVAQGMMAALANNDTKAYAQLKDMYDLISSTETPALNSTTQKALAQSANGENSLNQLESTLQSAGGGSGPLGGLLRGVLGGAGLDNSARLFAETAPSTAAQLARAFGETGALSDGDIKRYQNMLPKLTDTQEVAARKLQLLRQRIQTAHQNTLLYGAGATQDPVVAAQ